MTHELLSVLGVIVTITLASAANLHLEFNRLEDEFGEEFADARHAVKAYAYMLITLFAVALVLVLTKPLVGAGDSWSPYFNSVAILIMVLNIFALADLTMAVFAIPAKRKIKHDDIT